MRKTLLLGSMVLALAILPLPASGDEAECQFTQDSSYKGCFLDSESVHSCGGPSGRETLPCTKVPGKTGYCCKQTDELSNPNCYGYAATRKQTSYKDTWFRYSGPGVGWKKCSTIYATPPKTARCSITVPFCHFLRRQGEKKAARRIPFDYIEYKRWATGTPRLLPSKKIFIFNGLPGTGFTGKSAFNANPSASEVKFSDGPLPGNFTDDPTVETALAEDPDKPFYLFFKQQGLIEFVTRFERPCDTSLPQNEDFCAGRNRVSQFLRHVAGLGPRVTTNAATIISGAPYNIATASSPTKVLNAFITGKKVSFRDTSCDSLAADEQESCCLGESAPDPALETDTNAAVEEAPKGRVAFWQAFCGTRVEIEISRAVTGSAGGVVDRCDFDNAKNAVSGGVPPNCIYSEALFKKTVVTSPETGPDAVRGTFFDPTE